MRQAKSSPVRLRYLPARDGCPGWSPCCRSAKKQDRSRDFLPDPVRCGARVSRRVIAKFAALGRLRRNFRKKLLPSSCRFGGGETAIERLALTRHVTQQIVGLEAF